MGRKPVLDHIVQELTGAGVKRFQLITSERTGSIERYFARDELLDRALGSGSGEGWLEAHGYLGGCSFHFVRQEVPLGISDAVLRARAFVDGKPFFLHMGDSLITGDPDLLVRMVEAHQRFGACCSVAIHHLREEEIRGGATVIPASDPAGDAFAIEAIIEKPAADEILIQAGLTGRYLISAPMLEMARCQDPRVSALGGLGAIFPAELAGPVIAVWCRPEARHHDAGTLDGYLRAQAFFALSDEKTSRDVLDMIRGAGA